jgi:hypothetical protein
MKLFVRAFAIAVVAFGTFAASSLAKMPATSTSQVASRVVPGPPANCPPTDPNGCGINGGQ